MHLDLSSNYFELFGLSESFTIDQQSLVTSYQQLQQQFHPDKFASRPDAERRWSLQAASVVNDAYQTLRSDLGRAGYLLQLHGIQLDEETDTQMDPMFLMEQMELREALELAEQADDTFVRLANIRKQLRASIAERASAFETAVGQADWSLARTITRQWQFLDKLQRETKSIEERLDA